MTTGSVAISDVDEDGDLDIVIGNFNQQDNQLLINNGIGGFADSILVGGSLATFCVAVIESVSISVVKFAPHFVFFSYFHNSPASMRSKPIRGITRLHYVPGRNNECSW